MLSLIKGVMDVVGEALKANITSTAPIILPVSNLLQFMFYWKRIKAYMPDFHVAFHHFSIHVAGYRLSTSWSQSIRQGYGAIIDDVALVWKLVEHIRLV